MNDADNIRRIGLDNLYLKARVERTEQRSVFLMVAPHVVVPGQVEPIFCKPVFRHVRTGTLWWIRAQDDLLILNADIDPGNRVMAAIIAENDGWTSCTWAYPVPVLHAKKEHGANALAAMDRALTVAGFNPKKYAASLGRHEEINHRKYEDDFTF